MIHNQWLDTKPEFTEECILITGSRFRDHFKYTAYQIKWVNIDEGYMGWFTGDNEEYGDLADLRADRYYTMPLLK